MIVDLFSGIGWDVAARTLGLDPIGLDIDPDVCATRALHNMPTIRADIATYPTHRFTNVDGLIASPPCQDFSRAGKRAGLASERGQLVWQVERWATDLRPRWVACEQTEDVLPIWDLIAHRLRDIGYRTWTGLLHAERYGVPQTRTRAILLASLDKQPHPPEPTHQKYVSGEPAVHTPASMFHGEILPWVSMAEALGWTDGRVGFPRRDDLGTSPDGYRDRDWRDTTEPAFALTEKARSWTCVRTGNNTMKHSRTGSRAGEGGVVPYERPTTDPAPTLDTSAGTKWTFDRPATTIACDPRVALPGHHDSAVGNSQFGPDPIRLSVEDALILQSFPPGFELAGTKTARFRQIGNAVPPLLAAAVLKALA